MPELYIYPKKGDPIRYLLEKEKISLGRSADNDIYLQDPFCSGHHAFISTSESGYVIRDNGSKNGTFLNGKKIEAEIPLNKGDDILIGSTRISFDKEISNKVEVRESPSSSTNINTMVNVKEILKKADIDTTIKGDKAPALDLEKIKSDHKAYSVLSRVSQALLLHKPLNELLEHIMDLINENLPMDRGILMLKEGNPPQLIPKVVRINNQRLTREKIQVSQSIVNMSMEKHSSCLISDAQADTRFKSMDSVIKFNIHSAMCIPLWNNREIIGIIYSDRILNLERFTDEDLRLLTLLSNLAAVKIENAKLIEKAIEKERMEKELKLASQIQKDFLPRENPTCENFQIAGSNLPCYQVGGDYYDFIQIDPCRLGIVIADVSGKGMSASLLMASLRAALHSELHPLYKLEEMAPKLNNFVQRSSAPNFFISFFFCELKRENGEMYFVNAGHNPPVVSRQNGKIERLESCGLCLGMFPSSTYKINKLTLNPGDMVLLFTDGITESRNKKNEEFTEERLMQLISENSNLSSQELLDKIYEEVKKFTEGTDQMDDMTQVIIKRVS